MTNTEIGHLIEQLGQARDAGTITADDAIDRLLSAAPGLSRLGAHAQLRSWRGAAARWAAPVPAATTGLVDARTLTARTPIRFRVSRAA